ncbi:PTS transporter subunit EIIC [Marinilactibacillus sp. XAAS-LB27]|uniref:PTS transporter subunit EIIC n=1 Tax=Marinilactibacillus sp. XAAS-LB27 TaxID=3114538 RepID=UPI002E17AC88|nr:PTS transporter subunit EIIC [Marinilactibacillus sp. XAAS-LB27]
MESLGLKIVKLLGGEENIVSITHCATRLRPELKDHSLVDSKKLDDLSGVMGVVSTDSSVQIIIGTNVGEIYEDILNNTDLNREKAVDKVHREDVKEDKNNTSKLRNYFNRFIEVVVSIFSPLLPLFAGSGLLRGFTILATQIGILDPDSSTNLILTLAGTAVFYFLPILVAITTAKKFKTSPYLAVAIMGALIMPDFLSLVGESGTSSITFLGLQAPLFDYTGQVIPAIATIWIQSKMEHFMKAKLPSSLHMVIIPTVLLLLLVPLVAVVIGPVGNYISIWAANGVNYILSLNSVISGAIIGGIWNILILLGVHWAPNTTVVIPNIALTGESSIIAYAANANFGMAGAALAVFIRSKNKSLRNFSITSITTVFLSGIVEPAIYGLGVKLKTPLIAGCAGAAIGGAFIGLFNVVGYAFVFGGITTIPAFAGPTLWAYVTGLIISFVTALIITLLIGFKDPIEEQLEGED